MINHQSKILNIATMPILKRIFLVPTDTKFYPREEALLSSCRTLPRTDAAILAEIAERVCPELLVPVCMLTYVRLLQMFVVSPMSCVESLDSTPESYRHP